MMSYFHFQNILPNYLPKREYVARFLAEEYMIDKVAARESLFGPEPTMDNVVTKKDPYAPRIKVRYKT